MSQSVVIGNDLMADPPANQSLLVSYRDSILGPTLFYLFLNDIPEKIYAKTNVLMHAEDTKIRREISSKDDHHVLQRYI